MNFFEKFDIDPYEVLGVSKNCQNKEEIKTAYKQKALKCHPDKTNGKTEIEFKILNKSYKYAIKCITPPQKSHDILKKEYKEFCESQTRESQSHESQSHESHYLNPPSRRGTLSMFDTDRDKIFLDDDLDKNFEERMKEAQSRDTSYSPIDIYDNSLKHKFCDSDGKINREKFNAIFTIIKNGKEKPKAKDVVRYENILACNEEDTNSNFTKVNIYGTTVLNTVDKSSPFSYKKTNKEISNDDVYSALSTDVSILNKIIKQEKKDTKKIPKKKAKEELNKRMNMKLPEIEKRDFAISQSEMESRFIERMKEDAKRQKEFVLKSKDIRFIQ